MANLHRGVLLAICKPKKKKGRVGGIEKQNQKGIDGSLYPVVDWPESTLHKGVGCSSSVDYWYTMFYVCRAAEAEIKSSRTVYLYISRGCVCLDISTDM